MRMTPPVLPTAPPRPPRSLDPDAAAHGESGLFGFGLDPEECRVVAIPVPYEGTVSSRKGTVSGPAALIGASTQLDFLDPVVGEPWRAGLCMLQEEPLLRAASAEASAHAMRLREGELEAAGAIDAIGEEIWDWLEAGVGSLLDSGRAPAVVGGEHGISFGAYRAVAARHEEFGILQVDAHCDLREAYEGLRTSHASVMRRALELPQVSRLVQIGVRDFGLAEAAFARASGERVHALHDFSLARATQDEGIASAFADAIATLPETVWISFDIDGLEPSLCPGTGTPFPGGLRWREAQLLVDSIAASGRRVLGFDLVEIGPAFWDGLVAAKVFYMLAGVTLGTRPD